MRVMRKNVVPETSYPLNYREEDSIALASLIKKQESVCLVAMKKVGISNFVRFFFHHPEIKKKYFGKEGDNFIFIFCDLNNLLEVSKKSFWMFILKRFYEQIKESSFGMGVEKKVEDLYKEASIGADAFLCFDNLKKGLEFLVSQTDCYVVLILLRFDRLLPILDKDFFINLQSLLDAVKFHLIYLTTSVRPLPELCPEIFKGAHIATFAYTYFVKPAKIEEIKAISSYFKLTQNYCPKINSKIKDEILKLGGGHNMLTRLIGISFSESAKTNLIADDLLGDERILLILEEIWENLTPVEQNFLTRLVREEKIEKTAKIDYLLKAGILKDGNGQFLLFSPLFKGYILKKLQIPKEELQREFTKKENLLLSFLLENKEKICGRDEIINAVWPEYKVSDDLAVSDWSIDRLVWRLRGKIKTRGENYKIITIRGRGYKLFA